MGAITSTAVIRDHHRFVESESVCSSLVLLSLVERWWFCPQFKKHVHGAHVNRQDRVIRNISQFVVEHKQEPAVSCTTWACDRANCSCPCGDPPPLRREHAAAKELDNFAHILEQEGVIVRRPEVRKGDFDRPIITPDFESKSQLYAAMPRDVLIVV